MNDKNLITPESFWIAYSRNLKELEKIENNENSKWKAYQKDKRWTPWAMVVSRETMKDLGLVTSPKKKPDYYKIDLLGYTENVTPHDKYKGPNWYLNVAYEHENRDTWDDEVCKLCYIASDLRVVSTYYNYKKNKNKDVIVN